MLDLFQFQLGIVEVSRSVVAPLLPFLAPPFLPGIQFFIGKSWRRLTGEDVAFNMPYFL